MKEVASTAAANGLSFVRSVNLTYVAELKTLREGRLSTSVSLTLGELQAVDVPAARLQADISTQDRLKSVVFRRVSRLP